ncbi:hypothetical protein KJ695_00140 [Patescibacteria group bacterium]|nr:hypothetical protein [Patescibacteria group bacterium]MBU4056308.1 hypothetical protein [Patescibacteria group bacterium]MBU4368289.1 hypothetical protein [Patescibacteria group bacterium]
MSFSEQEKIKIVKSAFQKFVDTVLKLLAGQRALFEKIMKQIEARKIAEHREKIKNIFNSNK